MYLNLFNDKHQIIINFIIFSFPSMLGNKFIETLNFRTGYYLSNEIFGVDSLKLSLIYYRCGLSPYKYSSESRNICPKLFLKCRLVIRYQIMSVKVSRNVTNEITNRAALSRPISSPGL